MHAIAKGPEFRIPTAPARGVCLLASSGVAPWVSHFRADAAHSRPDRLAPGRPWLVVRHPRTARVIASAHSEARIQERAVHLSPRASSPRVFPQPVSACDPPPLITPPSTLILILINGPPAPD